MSHYFIFSLWFFNGISKFEAPNAEIIRTFVWVRLALRKQTPTDQTSSTLTPDYEQLMMIPHLQQCNHRVNWVATTTFWRIFHHDGKINPGWCGSARPPPFAVSTLTYNLVVYAPAERADTFPYFYSIPICTLWMQLLIWANMLGWDGIFKLLRSPGIDS